jgi:uncharacterized protein with FMN-binding domain
VSPNAVAAAASVLLLATRAGAAVPAERTKAEVEEIIETVGRTPPEWWKSVRLTCPDTLDLTWASQGGWAPEKHLAQYLQSVIEPNESRWREGVKLLHKALTVNRDDRAALERTMSELARLYQYFLLDHARAAFWRRKAGDRDSVELAECCWRLGGTETAREMLERIGPDETRTADVIRLWAAMGDLKKALALAREKARAGMPATAYLAAAEACRRAGKHDEAVEYYRKVLAIGRADRHLRRHKERARAGIEAVTAVGEVDLARVPDGTYTGSDFGYRSELEVEVTVKAGRIESVRVVREREDIALSSLTEIPRRIVEKQRLRGIDAVTGATMTSEAIVNATAKALAKTVE